MSQATFVDPAVEFARLVAGARGLLSEASVLAGSGAVSEVQLAGLTQLIEPMLILFVGGVVGFIVIAMFLPLMSLTKLLG